MKIQNLIRLNWTATFRLNFCAGGMAAVWRMPIKVYGALHLNIKGKILLPNRATRNTLIIGSAHEDYITSGKRAQINLLGTWQIGGPVRIGPDSFIGVGEHAILEMKGNCYLGRDTQIHCYKHIVLGKDVYAGELYATDTDAHTIFKDGIKQDMLGEVLVGNGVYLGFRTMLLKGTHIPPFSVVASGAICNKDYRTVGTEKLLLAGVPAMVKHIHTTAQF